eukprot:3931584-Rhodomonas_salina.3
MVQMLKGTSGWEDTEGDSDDSEDECSQELHRPHRPELSLPEPARRDEATGIAQDVDSVGQRDDDEQCCEGEEEVPRNDPRHLDRLRDQPKDRDGRETAVTIMHSAKNAAKVTSKSAGDRLTPNKNNKLCSYQVLQVPDDIHVSDRVGTSISPAITRVGQPTNNLPKIDEEQKIPAPASRLLKERS